MQIEDHYSQLLGVHSPWDISDIDLDIAVGRVEVGIEYTGLSGACPECGILGPLHDKRKLRTWRHLDTMQFSTFLKCQQPRIRCQQHGVQTVSAPWCWQA